MKGVVCISFKIEDAFQELGVDSVIVSNFPIVFLVSLVILVVGALAVYRNTPNSKKTKC